MTAYIYREDCGEEIQFEADSEEMAIARVDGDFRTGDDFDGDGATLYVLELDEETGVTERVAVGRFDPEGDDEIIDVDQMRYR